MGLKSSIDLLYNAILNGPAVQLTRYPTLAAGSALTASGMTTGVYKYAAAGANQVQTIAAGLNLTGMWIAGGHIANPSSVVSINYILWIGRGTIPAAVRAAELQWLAQQVTAVGQLTFPTLFLPIMLFVRAGVAIALDLASSDAANDSTANGAVFVYTGLGA